MKKILLSLMISAVLGITAKVQAQCTLTNVVISVNGTPTVSGGGLNVNFNASFDIDANGGNKYIYITSWKTVDWPNYWQCNNGVATLNPKKAPLSATLANSFLRIGINNDVTNPTQPTLLTTYGFDPSVTITSVGGISKVYNAVTVSGVTYDRFTLTGVQVFIPGITNVNDPISVTSDVFSTQAAGSGPNSPIHCINCGITQFFNDPKISGIVPCSSPRVVNFAVTSSLQPNTTFYYRIYRDNGNETQQLGTSDVDVTVGVNPTVTTDGSGQVALNQYPIVQPPAGSTLGSYWVQLTKVGASTGVTQLIKPFPGASCAPLPVDFKSFTATRSRSNVMLKWETSSEKNNSGFAVERSLDNATWQEIAFVPTQATGGNSSTDLSYQYIDLNNSKGVTQYRIKQVDIDSRSKYSEIRSVKGDGQMGNIIVYPNPTADGRINVVFDDANTIREIAVVDMSGRTVKQIRGISNNNVTIENLQPGMYSLRVFVPGTGEQSVQKIVVNKR